MIAHRFEKRTEVLTHDLDENRSNQIGRPCLRLADRDSGMRSGRRDSASSCCRAGTGSDTGTRASVRAGRNGEYSWRCSAAVMVTPDTPVGTAAPAGVESRAVQRGSTDAEDPRAVIDWLLNRPSTR